MRRQLPGVALVLALATLSSMAVAQETTTGSIIGTVIDVQGAPMPGVTVTVKSEHGTKTYVTDVSGRYFSPYLSPGLYSVRAELQGFTAAEQPGIEVRLGKRLEVPITLKVGNVTEVVSVLAEAPVVDTTSTTTGGNLLSDTLNRLPVARSFASTLYLVPGVSSGGGTGNSNPSIAGSSGLDNSYIVDGVNITDPGFGGMGSFSYVHGALGESVTPDFIEETQVKTGGFEAEYGAATGGVVNAITKSGTNSFRGDVFGYLLAPALESSFKQLQTSYGTVNRDGLKTSDLGVSIGGPLVKDKLFFFGVFNPQFNTTTYVAPPNFPLGSLGKVDVNQSAYAYAAKLTLQLSSNQTVNVTAFGDPAKSSNGPQYPAAFGSPLLQTSTQAFSALDFGGNSQNIKYEAVLTPNWLVDATFSHFQNHLTETPAANTDQVVNAAISDPAFYYQVTSGGLGFYQDTNSHRYDFKVNSTNMFQAAGHHQLRYGVDYESMQYNVVGHITGTPVSVPQIGLQLVSGPTIEVFPDPTYGQVYDVTRGYLASAHNTPQKYIAAFLQDTWQIGRLTLRPGVRYEGEKLTGDPPLCHPDDSLPGAADGKGALIDCTFNFSGNWAPRLGATYDFSGTGKTKLYGSFSRFYSRIPNDLAARAMTADAQVLQAFFKDAALTQPLGAPYGSFFSNTPEVIQPDAKLTYEQEFVGGFEAQVGGALNLGVRYIHRTIPRVLEDAIAAPLVAFSLGVVPSNLIYSLQNIGPGSPPIGSFAGIPYNISEEGPIHKYDAVELTANKAFSDHWSLLASYRWSKLQGNFEGFFRNDNGQADPSITSLFDFPINDPSYTAVGVPQFGYQGDIRYQGCALGCGELPNDRTHQIKAYGNYTFRNFNAAIGINAGSGQVLTGLWANPIYTSPGEIPDSVRGSGIQTTDGFLKRTAFLFTADLRLDYTFKLASTHRFILSMDVFNLFNNQDPTNYDNCHDRGFGVPNPNFGAPLNGCDSTLTSYNPPRAARVGARFSW